MQLSSYMDLSVSIFNTLQFLYCIIFNYHTLCNNLTWPKIIVYVCIYCFIFSCSKEYIYYFFLLDRFINDVTVFSAISYARWFKNLFTSFYICEFNHIVIYIYIVLYHSYFRSNQMTFVFDSYSIKRKNCCFLAL